MVEQRGQMVAWLRKMVRRGSTDEGEPEGVGSAAQSGASTAPSGSGSVSPFSSRSQVPHAPAPTLPRQRLNIQDSASVMTIASSSKRRRQSIDTNASTRAMAAESVFSWSEDAGGTPGPLGAATTSPGAGASGAGGVSTGAPATPATGTTTSPSAPGGPTGAVSSPLAASAPAPAPNGSAVPLTVTSSEAPVAPGAPEAAASAAAQTSLAEPVDAQKA